jgi:hypothetical protein
MTEKSVTLILLRADRELWDGGGARLRVTDVSRAELKVLHDQRLEPGEHTILLRLRLPFDAGQVYGISVEAKKHRPAWQLINHETFIRRQGGAGVEEDEVFMRLMLVPQRAASSDLDLGHERLFGRGSPLTAEVTGLSKDAYLGLKPAAQMALLNVEAKLRETRLNGVPLASFVAGVRFAAVDRLFLFVRADLKQLIHDSPEFRGAPGHAARPDLSAALPEHPDSWKHRQFGAGNLQLSFSRLAEAMPGNADRRVFSVDADIDLERGVGHVFEWLDNKLRQKKTDQTHVYALLFSQGITPAYTLDPLPQSGEEEG